MKITIFTDNKNSWYVPYGKILQSKLEHLNHDVDYVFTKDEIKIGDICFLLSCTKIINKDVILRNKHTVVVHASDLPFGKGFSPLQWQILAGMNVITLTLFEANEKVDSGSYYFKEKLEFDGTELLLELRRKLADKINTMCVEFANNISRLQPKSQCGKETYFSRRNIEDDMIDPQKSLAEQFNHLRIADNEDHPLWFEWKGKKYILKIYNH